MGMIKDFLERFSAEENPVDTPIKVYLACDTGPSGFGIASRGLINSLIDCPEIELTVRTHVWGFTKDGKEHGLKDTLLVERLFRENRVNPDYVVDDIRSFATKDRKLWTENIGSNETVDSDECLIRDFEGKEDVWLAIGPPSFILQAPKDDSIYKIISTDYNVDKVPSVWETYLDMADETWVPSKWTKKSIENTFGKRKDIHVMPYGIDMRYEPTEYDCSICPHNVRSIPPHKAPCLRKEKFTFLMISRLYHIKGFYRTVKAFIEEFNDNDNVRLVIKTTTNAQYNFNPQAVVHSIVEECGYPNPPEIGITVSRMSTQYMYDLYGHVDCFLQLSRAECFGIAQLEAAYCGTPVIATNWSAQKEVLPQNNDGFVMFNDFTVETVKKETDFVIYEGPDNYPKDAKWAVPDIYALGKVMREVYEKDDAEIERMGQCARDYVVENYKWEDRIVPRLNRLRRTKHQLVT